MKMRSPILIDAFNALSGLHSFGMNNAAARQSQHERKLSPLTQEGKPPRDEKDECVLVYFM
jgi:hypothetical protein